MQATILFAPDLHKRDVDFTSIKGYTKACELVQEDILAQLRSYENPVFISLGDWYDKGYRSVARQFSDMNYDRAISQTCNGNAYICLGNHFYLERDSNPEMYIIQPNAIYKPKDEVMSSKPIFKVEDYIVIRDIQISFFHFSKTDKTYIRKREPGVKVHIGIYHDDCVVPSDIRNEAGYFGTTSNSYLSSIYEDIDLAIIGHIHASIGTRIFVRTDGTQVPLIVPGALAITENKDVVKHEFVKCPVLYITDDGKSLLETVDISTHMDVMKFYDKKEQKISESLDIMGTGSVMDIPTPSHVSLTSFLKGKGYRDWELDILNNMHGNEIDIAQLMEDVKDGCKRDREFTQELDE